MPEKWDVEADVVIVGYGGGSAITAISAAEAGVKDILILEKEPQERHVPSTLMSGGLFWTFTDENDAIAYMKATAMGLTPDDVCEEFGRATLTTRSWMEEHGAEVMLSTVLASGAEFPLLPGAESYVGYLSVVGPGTWGGSNFFNFLKTTAEELGARVMYDSPVKDVVRIPGGEVVGVVAQQGGKDVYVKARKAVVLGCGGFEHNELMKQSYLKPQPFEFYATPSNTGDGVNIAMRAGAQLWHMACVGGRLIIPKYPDTPTGIIASISPPPYLIVDQHGDRYANEFEEAQLSHAYLHYANHFDFPHVAYPRNPSWFIFDESRRVAAPIPATVGGAVSAGLIEWSEDNSAEVAKGWIKKADTIRELAGIIEIDPEKLESEIQKFNGYCEAGEDPDFGRPKDSLVPLVNPPYYAMALYAGSWGTQGGPLRNTKCQVIDTFGNVIPRLYAVGELGSFYGQTYQGGGMLTECIISGRWAGAAVAEEQPWE